MLRGCRNALSKFLIVSLFVILIPAQSLRVEGSPSKISSTPAPAGPNAAQTSYTNWFPLVFNQKESDHTSLVMYLSKQGFDACPSPDLSRMQIWWDYSPYYSMNLYIGGVSLASNCNKPTAAYVSAAASQGWTFVPTWVGMQSSCFFNDPSSTTKDFSDDTGTAYQQGQSEAVSAAQAAAALNLTKPTIIYFDLEGYASGETASRLTTCRNAAKSFINGWVYKLHQLGLKAGVYGGAYSSYLYDFWGIANKPDDIWIALWNLSNKYDPSASPYGIPNIPDSSWYQHRIRQYTGDHKEIWANTSWTIDSDVADGEVAAYPQIAGASIAPAAPALSTSQAVTIQSNSAIQNIKLLSTTQGWALVDDQLMWTADGGRTWSDITPASSAPAPILAVSFQDMQHGWLVRSTPDETGLEALATADGGHSWQALPIPTQLLADHPPISAVHLDLLDGQNGWISLQYASGSSFSLGALLTTRDGGMTWSYADLPVAGKIFFADAERGWLAGGPSGGELYTSSDGGVTWQPLDLLSASNGTQVYYSLPVFSGPKTGLLAATIGDPSNPRAAIFATHDGGLSWQQSSSSSLPAADIAGPLSLQSGPSGSWLINPGNGQAVSPLNALSGNASTRLKLPEGALKTTFNGNLTGWVQTLNGSCSGEKVKAGDAPANPQPLRCQQTYGIYATQDGGLTWNEITP